MTPVEKQVYLKNRKKQFGDLSEEILLNIDNSGLVYYSINDKGEKIYGSNQKGPLYSEIYFGPSLTQQQFKEDCDINLVLKKYGVHHDYVPGQVAIGIENFRDLSIAPKDLTEAMAIVQHANESFMDLPAELRRAVGDDARVLLELSSSEEGVEKLKAAGFGAKNAPDASEKASEALRELVSTLKKKFDLEGAGSADDAKTSSK